MLTKCSSWNSRHWLLRKTLEKKTEKSVRNIDSIEFVWRDHLIIGQKSNLNANLEIDPQIEEMPTIDRWKSSYESNAMSAFAILFAIIWLITCKKKLKRSNYMSQNTVPMIFYMVESLFRSLSLFISLRSVVEIWSFFFFGCSTFFPSCGYISHLLRDIL